MLCVHAARSVSSRAAELLDIPTLGEYARYETIAGSTETGELENREGHEPSATSLDLHPKQIRAVMEKTDLCMGTALLADALHRQSEKGGPPWF